MEIKLNTQNQIIMKVIYYDESSLYFIYLHTIRVVKYSLQWGFVCSFFSWEKGPTEAKLPKDHKGHNTALGVIMDSFHSPSKNCLSFIDKIIW